MLEEALVGWGANYISIVTVSVPGLGVLLDMVGLSLLSDGDPGYN